MKLFKQIFNKEEIEYLYLNYWQKPNEKLSDIAIKHNVSLKDLKKHNKIKDDKQIYQPRKLEIRIP